MEVAIKGLDLWIVEVGDGFDEAAHDVTKALRLSWVFCHALCNVINGFLDVFLKDIFVTRISPS